MPNTHSAPGTLRLASCRAATCTILAFAGLALAGCGDRKPEQPATVPQGATSQAPPTPPDSTAVATTPVPDSGTTAVSDPSAGTAPSAHTAPSTGPAWSRLELVAGTRRFIEAIDSSREAEFWASLSKRSTKLIDQGTLGPREKIWAAARQTLGDIENRKITVIGGSRDSVALRIDGLRMIDGQREDDPVIVHLLRERSEWKVMYPGLLYPGHDTRKGR